MFVVLDCAFLPDCDGLCNTKGLLFLKDCDLLKNVENGPFFYL
jgi:hypothetical protein